MNSISFPTALQTREFFHEGISVLPVLNIILSFSFKFFLAVTKDFQCYQSIHMVHDY